MNSEKYKAEVFCFETILFIKYLLKIKKSLQFFYLWEKIYLIGYAKILCIYAVVFLKYFKESFFTVYKSAVIHFYSYINIPTFCSEILCNIYKNGMYF